MSVNRIRKLDIHNRPFLTAIYGITGVANKQECFIEPNLVKVNRWQELYLYFKEENYDTLFYNKELGFWGYEKQPLRLILKPTVRIDGKKTPIEATPFPQIFIFECNSPNAANRKKGIGLNSVNDKTAKQDSGAHQESNSQIQSIQMPDYGGWVYNLPRLNQIETKEIVRYILRFARTNPEYPLAFVITNPQETSWSSSVIEEDITGLINIQKGTTTFNTRILIQYDVDSSEKLFHETISDAFFCSKSIIDFFRQQENEQYSNPSLFYIGTIEEDDIRNFLNKRRLENAELNDLLFKKMPLDEIVRKLSIEFPMRDSKGELIKVNGKQTYYSIVRQLETASDNSIIKTINSLSSDSAWIRLNQLIGIDDIKQQIRDYVEELHEQIENGISIHPHLFLSGNPGTGKTTLARLIGEILKDEGVLSRGHFVEAKPGDFISEYIGGTRPKTIQKCNEAQGGVLFIDEAYGLYNGKDDQNNQYGKEAVEVLLTYMENVKDMVIIFAGYPHDMAQLLKANDGFARRIDEHHRWLIKDYEPKTLVEIGKHLFAKGGYTMTAEFEKMLSKLYEYKYRIRDEKTWGNAGSAENIARYCISGYKKTKRKDKCLDTDCIDSETLAILKTIENHPKQKPLSAEEELVSRIGFQSVTEQFEKYLDDYRYARMHPFQKNDFRPHLIFKGNPGTGKTTAARLLGRMMKEKGLLQSDAFVECKGGQMQDKYVGGTPEKIKELCERAKGGVLFVDEAHRLYDGRGHDKKISYNDEVIGVLMTELEDTPDFICIFAGYPQEMDDFIRNSDVGFEDRVPNTIIFPDYCPEDLYKIADSMLSDYEKTDKFVDYLQRLFKYIYGHRHPYRFSNARKVQNIVTAIKSQYRALYREELNNGETIKMDVDAIPEEYLRHITPLTKVQKDVFNQQLNKLIGLNEVKKGILRVLDNANNARLRADRGLQKDSDRPDLTFVFRGNPGTGKTTVANMIGSFLSSYGLIDSPKVHLYGREKLIGDSDRLVKEMFDECFGAVLFIDEAHQLADDYAGREIFKKIVALMENDMYRGKLAIILAGYPDKMNSLINDIDQGGNRRFRNILDFEDFSLAELWEILDVRAREKGYVLMSECRSKVDEWFSIEKRKKKKNFGNAGTVENFIDLIINSQNNRVNQFPEEDNVFWTTILPEDVPINNN